MDIDEMFGAFEPDTKKRAPPTDVADLEKETRAKVKASTLDMDALSESSSLRDENEII